MFELGPSLLEQSENATHTTQQVACMLMLHVSYVTINHSVLRK